MLDRPGFHIFLYQYKVEIKKEKNLSKPQAGWQNNIYVL
jgi:hypothetical protein